jgi:hypothetical protein
MAAVSRHFSEILTRVPTRAGKVERAATGRSPDPGCHLHQTRGQQEVTAIVGLTFDLSTCRADFRFITRVMQTEA